MHSAIVILATLALAAHSLAAPARYLVSSPTPGLHAVLAEYDYRSPSAVSISRRSWSVGAVKDLSLPILPWITSEDTIQRWG